MTETTVKESRSQSTLADVMPGDWFCYRDQTFIAADKNATCLWGLNFARNERQEFWHSIWNSPCVIYRKATVELQP